jgi:hypothetical protein
MNRMQYYSRQKLRRWIWRKHNCKRGLWSFCSDEQLHTRYGLYALPLWAAWKGTR